MGYAYGRLGATGIKQANTHNPKPGKSGKKVVEKLNDDSFIKSINEEFQNSGFVDILLNFQLEEAEELFKNGEIEAALGKYEKLKALSSYDEGGYANRDIFITARNQIQKIGLGQNYFGFGPMDVPLLSRSVYENRIKSLLEAADRSYKYFLSLENISQLQEIRRILSEFYGFEVQNVIQNVQADISEAEGNLKLYESDVEFYKKKHKYLTDEIESMMSQEERLMSLTTGGVSFDFLDFVKGAAMMYSGGTAVFASLKAAEIASATDIFNFLEDNEEHISKIAKGFNQSGIMSFISKDRKKVYSEVDLLPLQAQIREFTLEALDVTQHLGTANMKIALEKSRIASLNDRAELLVESQNRAETMLNSSNLALTDIEALKATLRLNIFYIIDMSHQYLFL